MEGPLRSVGAAGGAEAGSKPGEGLVVEAPYPGEMYSLVSAVSECVFTFAIEAVETNEGEQETENGEKANVGGRSVDLKEVSTGGLLHHVGLSVHVTRCSDLGLWATHCRMKRVWEKRNSNEDADELMKIKKE